MLLFHCLFYAVDLQNDLIDDCKFLHLTKFRKYFAKAAASEFLIWHLR